MTAKPDPSSLRCVDIAPSNGKQDEVQNLRQNRPLLGWGAWRGGRDCCCEQATWQGAIGALPCWLGAEGQ